MGLVLGDSKSRRRPRAKIALALLALALFFAIGLSSAARSVASSLFAPFQRAFNRISVLTISTADGYLALLDRKRANAALRKRIDRLEMDKNALIEQLKRERRIADLTSAELSHTWPRQIANVIARSASDFERIVILDKGAADGVREGMPVITEKGLIGRIAESSFSYSKLLLINDIRSSVSARHQETRELFVVSGANRAMLEALYLPGDSSAKVGDVVISSGLGGIIPQGIIIGRIASIGVGAPDNLFREATVRPAANLDHLEEAMIIEFEPPDYQRLIGENGGRPDEK